MALIELDSESLANLLYGIVGQRSGLKRVECRIVDGRMKIKFVKWELIGHITCAVSADAAHDPRSSIIRLMLDWPSRLNPKRWAVAPSMWLAKKKGKTPPYIVELDRKNIAFDLSRISIGDRCLDSLLAVKAIIIPTANGNACRIEFTIKP